jgi:hypothetical protein
MQKLGISRPGLLSSQDVIAPATLEPGPLPQLS